MSSGRENYCEYGTRDGTSIRVQVVNGDRYVQLTEHKATQTDPIASMSPSSDDEYHFVTSPTYYTGGTTICWHTP